MPMIFSIKYPGLHQLGADYDFKLEGGIRKEETEKFLRNIGCAKFKVKQIGSDLVQID